jgi:hypothetical protein
LKSASFAAGIRLSRLLRLIARNKYSLRLKYIFRILFLLQNGVWASVFDKVEKFRYKKKLDNFELPEDPIFIIGHWRTGSTFLLQLMNLNSELHAPSLFDIAVPDSLLVSRKYYEPVMNLFIAPTRPMDNVKMGIDEPQEDEFALLKITDCSPLEKLIIPPSNKYFLSDYKDFEPGGKQSVQWKQALHNFYKKLAYYSNKRIIIKNPFHSMRIATLLEMYPDAKFIHIYRHPYYVIPSTIRMWDIVGKLNCLNNNWRTPTSDEVITLFDKMLTYINEKLNILKKHQFYEVKFEEFEKYPIQILENIYLKFNVPFSESDRQKTEQFLVQVKNYEKNNYKLSDEDRKLIDKRLYSHMLHYKYVNNE